MDQASAFYGVNSRELGSGSKDSIGLNKGLHELASGAELLDYFEQVMNQRFLPSGRVSYFPMHNYEGESGGKHLITSLVGGQSLNIRARKKFVDATHARTAVPSTHPPQYTIAPGVQCIPLNELPKIQRHYLNYVVIGGGKTGIDACLWLLQNGVEPACIQWIMPRDAWLIDRANIQPGPAFFDSSIGGLVAQLEAITTAASIPDLFGKLEAAGQLVRIDQSVEPTMFRCGSVTQAELRELRRIQNILRMGRVQAIDETKIVLERGSVSIDQDCLYIDCSASALRLPHSIPVFDRDRINLLLVRACQPLFSAAVIAYVESHIIDDAEKNAMCATIPSPERPTDWIRMWALQSRNRQLWLQHAGLAKWLTQSRLDVQTGMIRGVQEADSEKQALLQTLLAKTGPAMSKIQHLVAAIS